MRKKLKIETKLETLAAAVVCVLRRGAYWLRTKASYGLIVQPSYNLNDHIYFLYKKLIYILIFLPYLFVIFAYSSFVLPRIAIEICTSKSLHLIFAISSSFSSELPTSITSFLLVYFIFFVLSFQQVGSLLLMSLLLFLQDSSSSSSRRTFRLSSSSFCQN